MRRLSKFWSLTNLSFALLLGAIAGVHAHPGDGLIVDSQGNLYFGWIQPFTGPGHVACVWKVDKKGHAQAIISSQHQDRGAQSSNLYIAMGLDGQIYCSERQYLGEGDGVDSFIADLWRVSPNGEKTRVLGPERGRAPFGGGALAIDRQGGIIHATDRNTIHRRMSDGSRVVLAGGGNGYRDGRGSAAQFENLGRMAWGPEEKLYVHDGDSIRIIAKDGAVTTLASGLEDIENTAQPQLGQSHFYDITVDENGNVFGADWGYRRVFKVSSSGEKSTLFRTKAPWSPEGIAIHKDTFYILETSGPDSKVIKPRIRKRSPDGTISTVFEIVKPGTP